MRVTSPIARTAKPDELAEGAGATEHRRNRDRRKQRTNVKSCIWPGMKVPFSQFLQQHLKGLLVNVSGTNVTKGVG